MKNKEKQKHLNPDQNSTLQKTVTEQNSPKEEEEEEEEEEGEEEEEESLLYYLWFLNSQKGQ